MRTCIYLFMLFAFLAVPALGAGSLEPRLDQFEAYAASAMKDWKVPGMAIAVVRDKKTIFAKGFGTRETGKNLPVSPDTIFQVGSTTKAFTVALAAQLVDEGQLDWNERVVDHDPAFMLYDPWVTRQFTIHDLFAQHSGMPAYAGDAQAFLGFDRNHIIHSMRYIKPVYSFRDAFSYVNNLFVAGARVLERKTGTTWERLMEKRILLPLGMKRSSLTAEKMKRQKNATAIHTLVQGEPRVLKPGSLLFDWPYVYGPAGGLNSTANDMARWIAAQMNDGELDGRRIFSQESSVYMHTPRTVAKGDPPMGFYCQGWLLSTLPGCDLIWHNGGTSGINSFVGFSPDLKLGLVVLTNLGSHKLADALGLQLFDSLSGNRDADWNQTFLAAVQQEDSGEEARPPKRPGLPVNAYAGRYTSPVYGAMEVTVRENGLSFVFGPSAQHKIVAGHNTMNTFTGQWPDFCPDDPEVNFDFQVSPDGTATGLTVRELNEDRLGFFAKAK